MNKTSLDGIARDLTSAVVKSGDIRAILFVLVFVIGIIAIIAGAAAVDVRVVLVLVPWLAFFGWRVPSVAELGKADRTEGRVLFCLRGICRSAERILNVEQKYLRSNVFRKSNDGLLRIVPGWHYNMDDRPAELGIAIPEGSGSTGSSYRQRAPVIARAKGGWGTHTLSSAEMAKIHPELQWIVSVPIPKPNGGGEILGILNADGLHEDLKVDQLRPLQEELMFWAGQIGQEIEHLGQEV
jgi:hypothetical protein